MRGWAFFLLMLLAAGAAVAEEVGPDGFPLDYQPEDFAVGGPRGVDASVTGVVSGTVAVVTPTGTMFRVEDLPRVSGSVALERQGPSPTVVSDLPALPQPARVVATRLPKTADEMAGWGPLTARTGGLGGHLWVGVSRRAVEPLLAGVARTAIGTGFGDQEAVLGGLVERLLLTAGEGPQATAGDLNWLARRAQALAAMGRDEAAWQLWQAMPGAARVGDMRLARGWTEAALVVGEVDTACEEVRDRILKADGADKPFWQQAVAVCQLLQNQRDGARLSWQLAVETPGAVDPLLLAVVTAWLQDGPLVLPKGAIARDGMPPLAAALLAARPDLLNGVLVERLPSVALRRVVNSGGLPLKMRLAAAEQLAHRTRLAADGQAVRLLYQAMPFDAAARADPLGTAAGLGEGIAARALLWQVASDSRALTSLRVACWQRWRQVVLANGLPGLAAGMPLAVAGVKPGEDVAALAPLVLADAWRGGDGATAQVWLGILNGMKALPVGVSATLPQWRLQGAILAGGNPPLPVWRDWLNGLDTTAGTRTLDAGRILAVAGQRKVAVPEEVGLALLAPASGDLPEPAPGAFWREALLSAARDGRVGVAVLLLDQPQAGENPLARGWLEARMAALAALGEDVLGDGQDPALRLAGVALAQGVDAVGDKDAGGVARPRVNAGRAPVSKGREIGGTRLKMTPAGKPFDGGGEFILPPPRVPAPHRPVAPTLERKG